LVPAILAGAVPRQQEATQAEQAARLLQEDLNRKAFEGLPALGVDVLVYPPEAQREGFPAETFKTDVQLRLRQNGLRVLEDFELEPHSPLLKVSILLLKREGGYVYRFDIELSERVALVRKPAGVLLATTWHDGAVGITGKDRYSAVRDGVREYLDRFINQYLAANPKR